MALHQFPISLVAALVLLAPAFGQADGTAEQADADQVTRLIRQLGSDQFRERQQASTELEAIGEPAWEALADAAARSDDPEVRRRARQLVRAIESRRELHRFLGHTEPVHRV